MKEVKFVVMVEEGNARSGYADFSEEGYPERVLFDTYEEAHAHMHELGNTVYKEPTPRRDILFVDALIVGGGDTLVCPERCTCTLKEGEYLYD